MENQKIYGVDLTQKITPLMVRDAISQCFFEAHCQDTGLNTQDEKESDKNKLYCQQIVKKTFEDSHGNFGDPNKQDILNAMEKLKEFSKNFRDQSIVQKHFEEILVLINKLK
ncbi:hypothetical protein A3I18_00210 [Candidatus Campbellbacteria bacterium RIFCSPLOWO2_02_FULL_35_11]|uniref:Uncharacterized protein n=2 Tax=Candidatus Campbelliibacteriota TaxID=1752727 RepID=A0A1F5ENQ7_9BACT|nr:MAG: hypothetical protein A3E89_01165 [Candidatus Campbellbacteria bacterium RIFCSPHIGHO2_12_FULL_35_10]OGD70061.1 MAG: hypothetical protein A3I18_00210 [Candidatus Campbellbacteria bacterium RIFCSPLOWO2_02_FULL_35_11]